MDKRPSTLNELFTLAVEQYRDEEFLRFKCEGEWQSLNYGEVARRVRELTLGLYSLGLRPGDKIAIWSENRPEWNIADLSILALGAVDVPIYTTQSRQQVEYILVNSEASALFVSSSFQSEALSLAPFVPGLKHVITFDSPSIAGGGDLLVAVEELAATGRVVYGQEPKLYENLSQAAQKDDLATLIYTSGTTGEPKGVMLTHENLTANTLQVYRWLGLAGYRDVGLTYLPFSHIFERAVWYLYAYCGTRVAYAESIEKVAENLLEIRPTVMTSVPRMFEKIYARILEKGLSSGFPKRQLFSWSLGVGKKVAELRNAGEPVGAWQRFQHYLADRLVFQKWRDVLGGRIRVLISGGAPLAPEIGYAFSGAGILILQGYGLTETSPSITCNTEEANRIGSVGRVIDGVSVKIDEDGEILVKGRTVMKGYYKRPELNEEIFTEDGWLRTGDIGRMDEDGFLHITDRKKDLLKTSGGKYIAPQPLESLMKSSRFISQVVVVGNNRKFASALIVPNAELVKSYAALKGITYSTYEDLLVNPRILDLIQRQVEKATAEVAKYERVKRVLLLEKELTIESGELTPTLKPRRSVIEKKYAREIDALYAGEGDQVVTR